MMKVFEHDHPLKLIDLQVKDGDVEDSDEEEEEKDVVIQKEFVCPCKRCDLPIHEYYRYYYKCVDDSCDYSLHKFCVELPATLNHVSYSHPLKLAHSQFLRSNWLCKYCHNRHKVPQLYYTGDESSYYREDNVFYKSEICVSCGVEADKRRIHHPSHPHALVPLMFNPILCDCKACGREHKGIFFQCTTCSNFAIHTDCAFLPKRLLIQQSTNDIFHHTHPLTLSYSLPSEEFVDKYYPRCRVCNQSFAHSDYSEYIWIYKCDKCIYYVHVYCAREEPSRRRGPPVKNFKDADYPHLFHLPFPDQTCSIPRQLFFKEIGTETCASLRHTSHPHELILVNTKCIGGSSTTTLCHDPMKKIELLCNACVRPIMEMPFYKCGANEDERCNFVLHEWCTRLPTKVDNHPGHPQHTLLLVSNVSGGFLNIFNCGVCCLPCNGYAYGCDKCDYYVDVTCAFIPENITHKSHPNHLLSIRKEIPKWHQCLMCVGSFDYVDRDSSPLKLQSLCFGCNMCNVYIHPGCALLLPETITHPYDKHPMNLSYLPVENHKSEYFCEICENALNPHYCFYHCHVCLQSVHSACAPLILCCETETYSIDKTAHFGRPYHDSIYWFINVKFGSIHKIDGHPHPLSFAQGIETDGQCTICSQGLKHKMIFKCLKCKYVIDYKCCESLNKNS